MISEKHSSNIDNYIFELTWMKRLIEKSKDLLDGSVDRIEFKKFRDQLDSEKIEKLK